MLGRASAGMDLSAEALDHWSCIQGKADASQRAAYDRSSATMS
jgi:hypothetical protein